MRNLFTVLATILSLISCSKGTTSDYSTDIDIYIAGRLLYKDSVLDGVWKNGVKQQTLGQYHYISAIAVSGDDIYLGGSELMTPNSGILYKMRPVVYKNGVPIPMELDENNNTSRVYDIAVSGNDIYAVGYEGIETDDLPRLWKNGIKQELEFSGQKEDFAKSVAIAGNDVYVLGTSCIWKNGVIQQSYPSDKSRVLSITTSGNNICLAGYRLTDTREQFATAWVNGKEYTMTDFSAGVTSSTACSAIVSGNDVLVVGQETIEDYDNGVHRTSAVLWINGIKQELDINEAVYSSATSVVVSGNDIYVSGTENKEIGDSTPPSYLAVPVVWKNGKKFYPSVPGEAFELIGMAIIPRN